MSKINFTAEIINGGRITIPRPARVALGLKVGDFVEIDVKKTLKIKETKA
jgi:bifunctional DNA-binding transcriptional regulator/antitoxin component of YhaV-PrlF toxin-antitoxin module